MMRVCNVTVTNVTKMMEDFEHARRPVFLEVHDIHILARRSALRPDDIFDLDWTMYEHKPDADGLRWLNVTPNKTKKRTGITVTVPLEPERDADVIEMLERRRTAGGVIRATGLIFPPERGARWNGDWFNAVHVEIMREAELTEWRVVRLANGTRERRQMPVLHF